MSSNDMFGPRVIDDLCSAIQAKAPSLEDPRRLAQVESVVKDLQLSVEDVIRIQQVFQDEMEKGIREEASSLQMENTYIPELPDGTEEGRFLALDLGGTNFRLIMVEFEQGKMVSEIYKRYTVHDHLRVGNGVELFDFLAQCIYHFVDEQGLTGIKLPLGFTFSFPMVQKALDVGHLVTWTKTFNCPAVVGADVVELLRSALERRGDTHVEVLAILNDTSGTLMAGAMQDPRTAIGLILGTGSNACYIERADRVQHWEGQRHGEKQVIIDIEWGAFGDNGVLDFIKTDFDRQVDSTSIIVNSFTFEKYISGKYMGEVVRVVLTALARDNLLFQNTALGQLLQHGSLTTAAVSDIEFDSMGQLHMTTQQVLTDLGLQSSADDVSIVQYVCQLVSNRAALLVSICLATLVSRMDRDDTTIAVDGSLFKHHPRLKQLINTYISILVPHKKFQLMLAEDGSGKGAGLVAAIALKLRQRLEDNSF